MRIQGRVFRLLCGISRRVSELNFVPETAGRGSMSINQIELISAITKHLDKQGVKEMLPRQFNAVIAAADSIIAAIETPEIKAKAGGGLQQWLASDGVGMSSRFMASVLSGQFDSEHAYPYDSADFGRCVGLIEAVPEFADKIPMMEACGPVWSVLAKMWPDLQQLYKAGEFEQVTKMIGVVIKNNIGRTI